MFFTEDLNQLVSFRDAANYYGVDIDKIKQWIRAKKLTAQPDEHDVLKITALSMYMFDAEYAKISLSWPIRQAMMNADKQFKHKYELTSISICSFTGHTLYRIRALIDFTATTGYQVKAGDLGGWVESTHNLAQNGTCWIMGDTEVYEDARIIDNALISGQAQIYGHARICENATVCENARVHGHSYVGGTAVVCGSANVSDYAIVTGSAVVADSTCAYGHTIIRDNSQLFDCAEALGYTLLHQNAIIKNCDTVTGIVSIHSRIGGTA